MSKPETPCLSECIKSRPGTDDAIHHNGCPNVPKAEAKCLPGCYVTQFEPADPFGEKVEHHAIGCPKVKAEAPPAERYGKCDDCGEAGSMRVDAEGITRCGCGSIAIRECWCGGRITSTTNTVVHAPGSCYVESTAIEAPPAPVSEPPRLAFIPERLVPAWDALTAERDALKAQNADLKHDIACLESKLGVERRAGEAAIAELERLRDLIVNRNLFTVDLDAEADSIRAAREAGKT